MTELTFNKKTHVYELGGKPLISVTQLMKKHGLAPDYSNVREDVLQAKAERGEFIHAEIEHYIKAAEIGFSKELQDFIDLCEDNGMTATESEQQVHNDIVAGTLDCRGTLADGTPFLADFKTTSTLHKEAVRWQLSIYNSLAGMPAQKLFVFLLSDKTSKVEELEPIAAEEVEALFECERTGTIYQKKVAEIDQNLVAQAVELQLYIQDLDEKKKSIEMQEKALKEKLKTVMEAQGVKSFENERLKITYVAAFERETIDSTRLKKELPDIAEQYKKKSKTAASVRITLKNEE